MGRPQGSRNALIRITYDDIGALAGIRGDVVRRYAQRGLFDARDLASVLRWVNGLRQQQALPMIGVPADNASEGHSADDDPGPVSSTPTLPEMAGIFRYNPHLACFEGDDA